jgi:SAM-dependent methyltransferase
MNIYKNYAKYYDLLYSDKNYRKEAAYINGLISKYSKNSKNILELGCGTGIHAIELAKKGYRIDGVDSSKEMLARAKKRIETLPVKLASKLRFFYGDMRRFENKRKYDIVISLFNVINYMTTNEDIEAAIKNANKHLKQGGLFVFDNWYGPAVLTDRPSKRIKKLEDAETRVVRTANPQIFPNENIVNVNYEILLTDKRTKKTEKYRETHSVRYFFKPELELFLRNYGFKLVSSQEWLTKKNPSFNTWNVCFVAKKIR